MTVQALHAIRHDGVDYKTGEILQINRDDEERLVKLGAAVAVVTQVEESSGEETPQTFNDSKTEVKTDSLALALGVMTCNDIREYGERLGITFPKNANKAEMIARITEHDADIVLDALTDAALLALAEAEGIDVEDTADRDALLESLGE